jgi:hypothetical protein
VCVPMASPKTAAAAFVYRPAVAARGAAAGGSWVHEVAGLDGASSAGRWAVLGGGVVVRSC